MAGVVRPAMQRTAGTGVAFVALIAATLVGQAALERAVVAQGERQADGPRFEVDPFWPKPLPNNWTFGEFSGVHVDSRDHVWVNQRSRSLGDDETYLTATLLVADCCAPTPSIIELDAEGNLIQAWGGPGAGYDWPDNEHGVYVDYKDNVWIGGNGANDTHVLKFTRTGQFLLQIGRKGTSAGSNDTANLKRPAQMYVKPTTNELFVADGYGNRRVVVFDADTGAYKRHWGAYGDRPDDAASNTPVPDGPPSRQFNTLHGVRVSKDGRVYAADRRNNRIQVFRPDGTFLEEVFIARRTRGFGVTYEVEFSPDGDQTYLYVPDGTNNHVWILNRETLEILGNFGRQGRYAGQLHHAHSIAVDSTGNIYVAETQGKRVQKFVYRGVSGG